MSEVKVRLNRSDLLAAAGRLSIAGTIGTALSASGLEAQAAAAPFDEAAAEKAETGTEGTATAVIDALEGAYGTHRGLRRNHTKGIGALGSFVGMAGRAYSRSGLFAHYSAVRLHASG
jgi:catalase